MATKDIESYSKHLKAHINEIIQQNYNKMKELDY